MRLETCALPLKVMNNILTIHLIQHGHAVPLLGSQHVVVLLSGGEPVQVDVHVPAGAEHRVLVHPDHTEVVSVLPQDL